MAGRWETRPEVNAAFGRVGGMLALALIIPGTIGIAFRVAERFDKSADSGWSALSAVGIAVGIIAALSLGFLAAAHLYRGLLLRRVAKRASGHVLVGTAIGEFAADLRRLGVEGPTPRGLYVVALSPQDVSVWRGVRDEDEPLVRLAWSDIRNVDFTTLQAIGRPYLIAAFTSTDDLRGATFLLGEWKG